MCFFPYIQGPFSRFSFFSWRSSECLALLRHLFPSLPPKYGAAPENIARLASLPTAAVSHTEQYTGPMFTEQYTELWSHHYEHEAIGDTIRVSVTVFLEDECGGWKPFLFGYWDNSSWCLKLPEQCVFLQTKHRILVMFSITYCRQGIVCFGHTCSVDKGWWERRPARCPTISPQQRHGGWFSSSAYSKQTCKL